MIVLANVRPCGDILGETRTHSFGPADLGGLRVGNLPVPVGFGDIIDVGKIL